MTQHFQPISAFKKEPYKKILCFPKVKETEVQKRLEELKKLGITHVSFSGPLQIEKCRILGKGYVGMVVLAKKNSNIVALKIRRTDSPRKNMTNEAKLLKIANKLDIGPKFIKNSKNFLIMEYIEGEKIIDWAQKPETKSQEIRSVLKNVLRECYLLDDVGLDHGELSTIDKHVIISKNKNTIIDFESSSVNRKPSNVTGAAQAILIGTGLAKIIHKKMKLQKKQNIINLIRQYKKNPTLENFDRIIIDLKLQKPGRFEEQVSLLRSDKKIGPLIKRIGPCSMRITKNPFQTLVEAIIYQQLSEASATAITKRFLKLYKKFPTPKQILNTSDKKLKDSGISGTKINYIKGLAKQVIQKEIDFRKISKLSDEQVVEELTKIKGIGNWTAQIYLMFCLQKTDILPVGDLGIQKGVRDLFSLKELPDPKTLEKFSARWKPNRSIACWYIWKSQRINSIG
jgi:putative serine/threonine protein kinase|tara:strand:- start:186 stop:1553 length:1368 start_codon:yes stop_codon:yes gene_type:complete